MKKFWQHRRAILIAAFSFVFLVWLGLESEVFARAGGGRSSGSRSYSSGGSTSRSTTPAQPSPSQQYQQTQPAPTVPPASPGRSFFSGLMGGMVGGLLGGMLFSSLGFAGPGFGGGFGLADIFLILVILGIIYFVVKRFRARQTLQMSMAGRAGRRIPTPGRDPLRDPFSARLRRKRIIKGARPPMRCATSKPWTRPSTRRPSRTWRRICSSKFREPGRGGI